MQLIIWIGTYPHLKKKGGEGEKFTPAIFKVLIITAVFLNIQRHFS